MPEPTDIRPHQTADFDQNFAKVNTDLDRFLAVFRDVRANGPGPRELDIAGLAGHLTEIGTVPGLADLLAAAIVRLAEPAPAAEPTPEQQHAQRIILSHAQDVEFLTIAEMLDGDDHPEPLSEAEFDQLCRRVDDLIGKATVTVTWPQEAAKQPPAPAPELTDAQGERLADAYNLGVKAEALREFADHLDAIEPYVPMTARTIAADARVKATDLDAQAEKLATTDAPPAPAAEPTEAQRLGRIGGDG